MILSEMMDEGICKITLNRPKAANAYTGEMIDQFIAALVNAEEDPAIRVVVITGAGRFFCAGGDVKAMALKEGMFAGDPPELRRRYQRGIQQIPRTLESMETPTVAMINGAAIGAGCDLACMCDLRYASDQALFGETFAQVGLVPGDGGTFFLARAIGYARAMELFLTAKKIDAPQALQLGLVHDVFPAQELETQVLTLCQSIRALPPTAVALTKRALQQLWQDKLNPQLDLLAAFQAISQRTPEHFEALKKLSSK